MIVSAVRHVLGADSWSVNPHRESMREARRRTGAWGKVLPGDVETMRPILRNGYFHNYGQSR